MARRRFSPLDRVLGRIDDLDAQNLAILARRLERERDLMETVLDTLREGVIVLSHDGAIEYANASAVRLLGVNPDDVAGAELRRLSPDIAQALELPETVGALTRELEVRYPEPRLLTLHLARVGLGCARLGVPHSPDCAQGGRHDKVFVRFRSEAAFIMRRCTRPDPPCA